MVSLISADSAPDVPPKGSFVQCVGATESNVEPSEDEASEDQCQKIDDTDLVVGENIVSEEVMGNSDAEEGQQPAHKKVKINPKTATSNFGSSLLKILENQQNIPEDAEKDARSNSLVCNPLNAVSYVSPASAANALRCVRCGDQNKQTCGNMSAFPMYRRSRRICVRSNSFVRTGQFEKQIILFLSPHKAAFMQKRSALWNKRNKKYRDRLVCDKEWSIVAKKTNLDSELKFIVIINANIKCIKFLKLSTRILLKYVSPWCRALRCRTTRTHICHECDVRKTSDVCDSNSFASDALAALAGFTDVSIIKKSVNANNQLLRQLLFDNHSENDVELDKLILQFPIGNETSLFEIEEKLTTDNIANKYLALLNCYNLYLIINNYN
ncbi:hypothetical protein QTP88_010497 [Uroleucon formosanum]